MRKMSCRGGERSVEPAQMVGGYEPDAVVRMRLGLSIFVETRQPSNLGSLRLATTSWRHIPSSSTGCKAAAASILLETTPALASWTAVRTASATSHSASVLAVATAISCWPWATLFDVDLLTPDGVRVSGDSGVVAGSIGEFDKGTVLSSYQ